MGSGKGQTSRLAPGRSRATAACTVCRQKRKKCVTDPGEKVCDHCKGSGLQCIFLSDDERRRPRSRVFMHSLLEHIELLEARLDEVEGDLPRQLSPPTSQPSAQAVPRADDARPSPRDGHVDVHAPLASDQIDTQGMIRQSCVTDNELQYHAPSSSFTSADNASAPNASLSGRDDFCSSRLSLQSLLSEMSPLRYIGTTGHLSYVSPATRLQQYGDGPLQPRSATSGPWNLQRRLYHLIEELDVGTHDYLMACFWAFYNQSMKIVDQEGFQRHKVEDGDNLHYSVFLHVCCLAMGFRFADKSQPGIRALERGNRYSTFHENARYLIETELEEPRGLTTVQSLLILSDLECASGRDRMGWMYAGLACRFAFEMGLTLDHSTAGLPRRDIEPRRCLLRACIFYDIMWATLTSHPTVIKRSDLLSAELGQICSEPWTSFHSSSILQAGDCDKLAWNALLSLMELTTRVVSQNSNANQIGGSDGGGAKLLAAATLHQELELWRQKFIVHLRWESENIPNPHALSLFLRLFFHHTILRIHYPFFQIQALPTYQNPEKSCTGKTNSQSQMLIREICLENAQTLVEVMHVNCERFGAQHLNVFVPHLTNLALPILLASVFGEGDLSRQTPVSQHLQKLREVLQKLTPYYQTAANMSVVLDRFAPQAGHGDLDMAQAEFRDSDAQFVPSQ